MAFVRIMQGLEQSTPRAKEARRQLALPVQSIYLPLGNNQQLRTHHAPVLFIHDTSTSNLPLLPFSGFFFFPLFMFFRSRLPGYGDGVRDPRTGVL